MEPGKQIEGVSEYAPVKDEAVSFEAAEAQARAVLELDEDEWTCEGDMDAESVEAHYGPHLRSYDVTVFPYPGKPERLLCFLRPRKISNTSLHELRARFQEALREFVASSSSSTPETVSARSATKE